MFDVRQPRASFLTRQFGRLMKVLLQPGQIHSMRGRDVLQVEQLDRIGRRVHLAGDEMGIGRNLNSILGEPDSDLRVVAHHREHPGIGLALVAAARAAIERGFVRIVLGCAPMRAKQHQPGEILCQAHHPEGRIHREGLLFEGEAGPGDPLLMVGCGSRVEVVLPA